jgi:biopolymer transport protein ExbD
MIDGMGRNRNAAKGRELRSAADATVLPAVSDAPPPRQYRPKPPDDVFFPVVPMLDMAFQLLAFFILTFKAPSAETHIDLHLPTTPAALPAAPRGQARPRASRAVDADLENDLLVRALADDLGDLKSLRLGEAEVPDLAALGERLRRYTGLLGNRPLRVRLVADDRLRYEPAAQIIATCSAAGVASVRLAQPGVNPALPGLTGGARPARGVEAREVR